MRLYLTALATGCAALLSASFAVAQAVSEVRLLPGWETDAGTRMIGVQIDLAPGWKTYWRAPGGNGIPPQFDFSGSTNIKRYQVYWPAPSIYDTAGVRTIGYADRVVFPVEVTPGGSGPIVVDLGLFYGVCEEVCIPVEDHASATIQPGQTGAVEAVRAALRSVAQSAADAGVTGVHCMIRPSGDAFSVRAELKYQGAAPSPDAVVFETGSDEIYIDTKAVSSGAGRLTIDAALYNWGTGALALDRSKITITLLTSGRAVEIRGCPSA